jgi:hypothetical protein
MPRLICVFAVVFALSACSTPDSRPDATGTPKKESTATEHRASPFQVDSATASPPPEFRVATASPPPDSTNLPRNAAISLRLSAVPDTASISTGSFRLEGVAGNVRVRGATVVFEPASVLAPRTAYTAVLAAGIKDSSGRTLAQEYRWRFTTGTDSIPQRSLQVPAPAGRLELLRYPFLQTDSPRRMRILWTTATAGQGTVWYQAAGQRHWYRVTASAQSYPTARTGLTQDFVQHEAVLEDLEPNATYTYHVSHNGVLIAEGIPFKTLAESKEAPVRFIVFGDSGSEYSEPRAVRDAIASHDAADTLRYPHDFIVGVGDIAYHNGTYVDFDQRFFNQLSGKGDRGNGARSILTSRPFFPVLGNHEYANKEDSLPEGFLQSFSNPVADEIPVGEKERYYSFDSGDAHFVVIDSMKFQGRPTAALDSMLSWLEHDLARTQKKWRIVFYHHAIFAHGPHGTYGDIGQNRGMRQRMAPILQKHGVQLAMNGHDHLYERSKRLQVDGNGKILRDRQCHVIESEKGIVYLTVGIGGYDLHNRKIDPLPCGTPTYDQGMREYGEGYDFVAFRNGHPVIYDSTDREPKLPVLRHGFAHVTVNSEAIRVVVYNHAGGVLDDFELR